MALTDDVSAEDFINALSLIVRRVRKDSPAEMRDFNWTQKSVLRHLETGPMTSAELARLEGLKPQSMGAAIASLEELGFVERRAHPTDGRQIHLKLSAKGLGLRRRVKDAKETWISQTLSKLDKQERAALAKATKLMKRMAEGE